MFVGLNPSTADETKDDNTVRRCIGFAKDWGFGSLVLVNLFAYRSTDPNALLLVADPVGAENDTYILAASRAVERVVVAWGTKGTLLGRDKRVASLLPHSHCLGVTKSGHPKHPLYLAAKTSARLFPATGSNLVVSTRA